jgi:hypothetical protein
MVYCLCLTALAIGSFVIYYSGAGVGLAIRASFPAITGFESILLWHVVADVSQCSGPCS